MILEALQPVAANQRKTIKNDGIMKIVLGF